MQLKYNDTESCSSCGCTVVVRESVDTNTSYISYSEEKREIREHTNGPRWETREFLCGYTTEYTPNFLRTVDTKKCRNNEDHKNMLETRKKLQKQIKALEEELYSLDR